MKSAPLLAGIICLIFATMPKAVASAENEVDSALALSKTWIGQIDAGHYDESYQFGCDEMHNKVPSDRWAIVLKALRGPWGPVTSRKQISHVYKGTGFEGTSGEFMVITYDSSFTKVNAATEVVVLKWEGGKWRGAGYNAGVKAPPSDGGSQTQPPPSATETHTDPHVKPQPK
jgi:hypothetical protein